LPDREWEVDFNISFRENWIRRDAVNLSLQIESSCIVLWARSYSSEKYLCKLHSHHVF